MPRRPPVPRPTWETRLLLLVTLVVGRVWYRCRLWRLEYSRSSIRRNGIYLCVPPTHWSDRRRCCAIDWLTRRLPRVATARVADACWCFGLVADAVATVRQRNRPRGKRSRRWIGLPGFSIQPAELAKLAAVVWTAMLATKKADRLRDFRRGLLPFLVVLIPVTTLVLFEPALSLALSVGLLAGIVLFAAGARIGHFLLIGGLMIPFLWREITAVQYRMQRWMTFLSSGTDYAESGWQIQQSLIGMGAGNGSVWDLVRARRKWDISRTGTPTSFSARLVRSGGFVGVVLLIALFALFVTIGLHIARTAVDRFGTLLAVGLVSMIGITAFVHMAVTLDIVPTTGFPLPFISYGRTNLVVAMFATGVLMNIGEHR